MASRRFWLVYKQALRMLSFPSCNNLVGLKRGPWTIEEDHKLMNFIVSNGILCWRTIPKLAGLLRCGKSCRLRWINYLRPDLKRGGFTEEEENHIIQLHEALGNRWSKIASYFVGRTDNEIKNHWNTKIKKRLEGVSVDPMSCESVQLKQTTTVSEALSVTNIENNQKKGLNDFLNKGVKDSDGVDLLSDCEIFYSSLEAIEHWLNEESIEALDGQSSSASFQESLDASMSEFSPELLQNQNGDSGVQHSHEHLHQWFDEMDSFSGFNNHLEDQFVFPEVDQL